MNKFNVGDRVRRIPGKGLEGFWEQKCHRLDKDPKAIYTIRYIDGFGFMLEGFADTGFMSSAFELAVPEDINLDDYL